MLEELRRLSPKELKSGRKNVNKKPRIDRNIKKMIKESYVSRVNDNLLCSRCGSPVDVCTKEDYVTVNGNIYCDDKCYEGRYVYASVDELIKRRDAFNARIFREAIWLKD